MRKIFILILIIFLSGIITNMINNHAKAEEVTSEEVGEVIKDAKAVGVGIKDVGIIPWLKSNWYFGIGTLIGAGRIIVKLTPTKKDDKIFSKIFSAFKFIGKCLSFGMG